MPAANRIRALGLLSGGLDSALAARLLLEQGIEVVGLHLESPVACRNDVHALARDLGIRLEVRDKGREYLRLLRDPAHGYGKHMNPCVDCRIFMFLLGQPYLEEFGAHFMFTGEVLAQRPMSQVARSLTLIDRRAGLEGRVLRPLSARLLPETEAERRGWVDRSRLLAISGRSRHEQLALAERYGLAHYGSPGGGCLLTDPAFSQRLRGLFDRVADADMDTSDVRLLTLGRHLPVRADLTLVVGRDAAENRALPGYVDARRWVLEPDGFKGPAVLACGPRDADALERALQALAAYAPGATPGAPVRLRHGAGEETVRLRQVPLRPSASPAPPAASRGEQPRPPAPLTTVETRANPLGP